ncbi:MAG: hypothetical protein GKR89_37215 [Candidatus Latescibacteria bacterium]|nr:hypothetical protein [Candidatus Latescibacterota bacterium]
MKEANNRSLRGRFEACFLAITTSLFGCNDTSEQIRDPDTGVNGSFEVVRSGLPVNWLIYTPATVPDSDFDVLFDTTKHVDGRQSLKFIVRACTPIGGWKSPGLAQEYPAQAGDVFNVSFSVMNHGAEFYVGIGGVGSFEGVEGPSVKTRSTLRKWRRYDWEYTMPEKMERLRINLNITKPGTFWIDDVRITRQSGEPVKPL